jgi:hypothetical protein
VKRSGMRLPFAGQQGNRDRGAVMAKDLVTIERQSLSDCATPQS